MLCSSEDPYILKYKWFTYVDSKITQTAWTKKQEVKLLELIKLQYPMLFDCKTQNFKGIKWSQLAFELSKDSFSPYGFKNFRQCKERWNNYLNPFLNRYSLKFKAFLIFA
jgi:hypothetical protein